MNDLWAEDIGGAVVVKTPVALLKEQASLLGKKTQNLVIGKVVSVPNMHDSESNKRITHRFYVVAPALGDYSYTLFSVSHGLDMYPLMVVVEVNVFKELSDDVKAKRYTLGFVVSDNAVSINSEDEFIDVLGQILKSNRVRQVINGLLAQSLEYVDVSDSGDVGE